MGKHRPDVFRGAAVLNALGARIGEVTQIHGDRAVIVVGAARDVFGFIDLPGGGRIEVPLDSLIMGKPKKLGDTMAVLPTFSTTPDAETLNRVMTHSALNPQTPKGGKPRTRESVTSELERVL